MEYNSRALPNLGFCGCKHTEPPRPHSPRPAPPRPAHAQTDTPLLFKDSDDPHLTVALWVSTLPRLAGGPTEEAQRASTVQV